MAYEVRARQLRKEYEDATGVWPRYPRSRIALQALGESLHRPWLSSKPATPGDGARKTPLTPRLTAQHTADETPRDGPRKTLPPSLVVWAGLKPLTAWRGGWLALTASQDPPSTRRSRPRLQLLAAGGPQPLRYRCCRHGRHCF